MGVCPESLLSPCPTGKPFPLREPLGWLSFIPALPFRATDKGCPPLWPRRADIPLYKLFPWEWVTLPVLKFFP